MNLRIDLRVPPLPRGIESAPQTIKKSFLPQWLYAKQAEKLLRAMVDDHWAIAAAKEASEPLKEDLWGFSGFWGYVKERYPSVEGLYEALKERHEAIRGAIEIYRTRVDTPKNFDPVYALIASLSEQTGAGGNYVIDPARLEAIQKGVSGSYFLIDENGERKFIVKPTDEDCGALNNPKGYATPFDSSPIRDNMPLYLSSLREALTYQIAQSIGAGGIVPKTVLAVLESSSFSYLIDRVSPKEMGRYLEECGEDFREKLCSLQEFIPKAKSLFEGLHDLQMAGLSDEEIANRFDQSDFEDANLLIWTSYDTDAHAGNLLVYAKGTDAIGNEILGFKKVDNGLSFPDKNRQLRNSLSHLPNAKRPLSEAGRSKVDALNIKTLELQLEVYGLGSAIPALCERISRLKELAKQPDITLHQINSEMSKLGKKK